MCVDAEISLIDVLRKGGFETSLITTFNAYLPFYEEVVLRRLIAAGCRHNLVLMDAGECSKAFAHPETRPRLAGFEYTLIPVRAAGAFHPKILLLAGRSKGLISVGSHNLTLSGFGYNRELTTQNDFSPKSDTGALALANHAWTSLQAILDGQHGHIPEAITETYKAMRNLAPWLSSAPNAEVSQLLVQAPNTPTLWDQVQDRVLGPVKKVLVVGAFFDHKLAFIDTLARRWPKAETIVGIDPASVEIPVQGAKSNRWRFVDAGDLHRASGYLHAKAVFFDTGGKADVLAIGSANPSSPAWLAEEGHRNVEAIVIHSGKDATLYAKQLGLAQISERASISPTQWQDISARKERQPDLTETNAPSVVVACECSEGIGFGLDSFPVAKFQRAILKNVAGQEIATISTIKKQTNLFILKVDEATKSSVREFVVYCKGGAEFHGFLHHAARIMNSARSGKQIQLRAALTGLTGGTGDFVKWISVVEKVIFDDADVDSSIVLRAGAKSKADAGRVAPERPTSLETTLHSNKRKKAYKRLLGDGGLACILDALIRRLGIGFERIDNQTDRHGRTEEEQRGQEDDDAPSSAPNELTDIELAQLCGRKARHVVTRMLRQLEKARRDSSVSPAPILQLVAVLGLLRELRALDKLDRWRKTGLSLVPFEEREKLLFGALEELFHRKYRLLDMIVVALEGEPFEEIAHLRGLLLWLAWDCDVNLDERFGIAEEPGDVEIRILDKAALLEVAPPVIIDEVAIAEARDSIQQVARSTQLASASAWLQKSLDWAEAVNKSRSSAGAKGLGENKVGMGDIAYVTSSKAPVLMVVSKVIGNTVGFAAFGEELGAVSYLRDRVASLPLSCARAGANS
jgi:hypothetical protein